MSHQKAKRIANEFLESEGSARVAGPSHSDHRFGVWIVNDIDPLRPDEILYGGGPLVVTGEGVVHRLGSVIEPFGSQMQALGIPEIDDPWAREGEGLALLADLDMEEAVGLAEHAQEQYRKRHRRDI